MKLFKLRIYKGEYDMTVSTDTADQPIFNITIFNNIDGQAEIYNNGLNVVDILCTVQMPIGAADDGTQVTIEDIKLIHADKPSLIIPHNDLIVGYDSATKNTDLNFTKTPSVSAGWYYSHFPGRFLGGNSSMQGAGKPNLHWTEDVNNRKTYYIHYYVYCVGECSNALQVGATFSISGYSAVDVLGYKSNDKNKDIVNLIINMNRNISLFASSYACAADLLVNSWRDDRSHNTDNYYFFNIADNDLTQWSYNDWDGKSNMIYMESYGQGTSLGGYFIAQMTSYPITVNVYTHDVDANQYGNKICFIYYYEGEEKKHYYDSANKSCTKTRSFQVWDKFGNSSFVNWNTDNFLTFPIGAEEVHQEYYSHKYKNRLP